MYADLAGNCKRYRIKSLYGNKVLGKSFLSAVYSVTRCILYPSTKICIASGTRGQSLNILEKIMYELKPLSAELRLEIDEKQSRVNGTEAKIVFKNSSVIKVVTASDTARGKIAHVASNCYGYTQQETWKAKPYFGMLIRVEG